MGTRNVHGVSHTLREFEDFPPLWLQWVLGVAGWGVEETMFPHFILHKDSCYDSDEKTIEGEA